MLQSDRINFFEKTIISILILKFRYFWYLWYYYVYFFKDINILYNPSIGW